MNTWTPIDSSVSRSRSRSRFRLRLRGAALLMIATAVAVVCAGCGTGGTASSQVAAVHSSSKAAGTSGAATSVSSTSSTTVTSSTTPALPGAGKPTVTIGDKNYTEQFILGQLYQQALQAQGYSVNLNPNIGPTEVTQQALKAGTLGLYPEYLDIFNTAIAGYPDHSFKNVGDAFDAAQRYAVAHGLDLLPPTPFSDTYAVATTVAFAQAHNLKSIADLSQVANGLTIGGPPQFQALSPGLAQMRETYAVVPTGFKALAIGDQYNALNTSAVQAADVNTTDGQLASGNYTVLSDPKRIFGWGNVVPVVSAKVLLQEGPAFADTIERVDAALTTTAMRQMNEAVDVAKEDPAAVAKVFLQTHGLLTPTTG